MKKLCALALSLILVLSLTSCGLVEEAVGEAVRENYGDEFGDLYDEALEQNRQELKELGDDWNTVRNSMRDELHAAAEEQYGEQAEEAKAVVDGVVEFIDSFFGSGWEYPVVDPQCSWRGYEEETWSWSELEFCDGRERDYHLGLDLKSSSGSTDILAAADGVVAYSSGSGDLSDGNGYHVILEHELDGETVYSLYSHLADWKDLPEEGAQVKLGERIGTMGSTGTSGSVHLHFAVFGTYQRSPKGRATIFTGNKTVYEGQTFYNPKYIIEHDALPD
ncbi:MAG: M23 family metallopeptidase [Hominenteromicrobium sp.]